MSENIVKVRLKFGGFEIDYEGSLTFLQNDLSAFIKEMADFCKDHSIATNIDPPAPSKKPVEPPPNENRKINLSTESIASRIEAKTGADLALAASLRLYFVDEKKEFSRQDILEEMKSAKSYYNKNMSGNLTGILVSLIKNKSLNETSSGIYALNAEKKAEMKEKLLD